MAQEKTEEKTLVTIPTSIISGEAAVIASGVIIPFRRKDPVEFIFEPSNGPKRLVIKFIDEEGKTGERIEGGKLDDETFSLNFMNFVNPLGTGSVEPIPLGMFYGKTLYLNFRIYAIGEHDKSFQYTFYLSEEAKKEEGKNG